MNIVYLKDLICSIAKKPIKLEDIFFKLLQRMNVPVLNVKNKNNLKFIKKKI